ncbi:twin-arginine translocation protein [Actibacterium atlanticum]|uniref:Sec-independent protein translocase protein TatB n=1 Tax=Actibacterium atlanticum TaxID=1461693 RepID=A0A058ZNR5_9RHOB|nr:Sec-independent protein translocase protein TatB [Actibacterium atlanticum]KCV83198.1 twin-arginine translocation protein [Actibacterium atlanticum]
MFDLGWTELLVVGIVALIVVGPKDLPGMFRTLGRFTAKAKGMAREFQRAMNDAADEAGVKDVASDLKAATNPKKMGLDAVNDAVEKFEKWQPPMPGKDKTEPAKTEPLSEERAEAARKINEATAKKAEARIAAQEAAKAEADTKATPEDSAGKTDA